ncbi:hypothetical protein P7C70_g9651, partial [Phenoliferia sp. Uapishka_3]
GNSTRVGGSPLCVATIAAFNGCGGWAEDTERLLLRYMSRSDLDKHSTGVTTRPNTSTALVRSVPAELPDSEVGASVQLEVRASASHDLVPRAREGK